MKLNTNISNPYVSGAEGRQEWNDRYFNMKKAIRSWQIAFFLTMTMLIGFAAVIVKLSLKSHVQPFVVETNNGMPYAVKAMDSTMSLHDRSLINFSVNQFIINARMILRDKEAEKNALNKVYAYAANHTIIYLNEHYKAHNPLHESEKYTVSINIVNSLPLSNNTWQVTWDETKKNALHSRIEEVSRWMAYVTYKFGDVNKQFITDNPFGFYITDVSWSQSQSR